MSSEEYNRDNILYDIILACRVQHEITKVQSQGEYDS